MSSYTVPPGASLWIASQLKLSDWRQKDLELGGLSKLTVSELKIIWSLLMPLTDKRTTRKNMLKNAWCEFIRSLFYLDGNCNVCDQTLLAKLLPSGCALNHQVKPAPAAAKVAPTAKPAPTTKPVASTTNAMPVRTVTTNTLNNASTTAATAAVAANNQNAALENFAAATSEFLQQYRLATGRQQQQQTAPTGPIPSSLQRAAAAAPPVHTPRHAAASGMPASNAPPPPPSGRVYTPYPAARTSIGSVYHTPLFATPNDALVPPLSLWDSAAAATATQSPNKKRKHTKTSRPHPVMGMAAPAVNATLAASAAAAPSTSASNVTTVMSPSVLVKQERQGVAQGTALGEASQPTPTQQPQAPAAPTPTPNPPQPVLDNQPSNQREAQLAAELAQMGFTNMIEVLNGIRTLQSQQPTPPAAQTTNDQQPTLTAALTNGVTVDDVMLWLIQQREEQEEARKMDEVRLHSEMLRKEAAEQRQQETQRQFMEASWTEWLASERMFANSWLLRNTSLQTTWWNPLSQQRGASKQALIDLLSVEKQARQWYGNKLPYCYFHYTLCQRFISIHSSSTAKTPFHLMVPAMQEQVQVLKTGMFTLSEQQGGVPRIFLNSETDAIRKGLRTCEEETTNGHSKSAHAVNAVDNENDDDDVVEIVDQPQRSTQTSNLTPSRDIIEIN